ncbi:hypothetical protein VNO77_05998 [Canavalia gladiata]|uniref:Uncharacterized protein n=1 Tax=Canavalia gladiata TaxID=3824 RepID=A0AAN9MZC1_CANGL
MQREEERERRRLRDRQRRQSMTQEQRERHLARRRRNYQLRRQRAANSPFIPVPQSTIGEASTSDHLQWLTPSDNTLLYHHGHQTSQIVEGSSIQLEGLPRRMRLNSIKRLARNLASPISANHKGAGELISGSSGDGNSPKPLRLNRVKTLARSLTSPSQKPAAQEDHNYTLLGVSITNELLSDLYKVHPKSTEGFMEFSLIMPSRSGCLGHLPTQFNVAKKRLLTLTVLTLRREFLRRCLSHIPSPCGAALLPLLLGTGHETHIPYFFPLSYYILNLIPDAYHLCRDPVVPIFGREKQGSSSVDACLIFHRLVEQRSCHYFLGLAMRLTSLVFPLLLL